MQRRVNDSPQGIFGSYFSADCRASYGDCRASVNGPPQGIGIGIWDRDLGGNLGGNLGGDLGGDAGADLGQGTFDLLRN